VLGKNKINIKMISGSEKKLTCVVAASQADAAARLIHKEFGLGD
jgi:aspartokinase